MKIYIIKQYNQNMTKFLPLLFLFIYSCTAPKVVNASTSFTTIYSNSNGGTEKASYQHITNNEAYIKLIESLKIEESEYNKLVGVNFKVNHVLVLFQGQKATGGYGIQVANMRWENEILMIQKFETLPEAGKPVTMSNTSPYCITVIPKAQRIIIVE